MQEFRDGSFGEIQEADDLFKRLLGDPEELSETEVIHLGTKAELEQKRRQAQSKADRARAKAQLRRK